MLNKVVYKADDSVVNTILHCLEWYQLVLCT